MQREVYTSCIKINGIPLLPPLMTDNVMEEMKRYKSLAMKVEERLKVRQLARRTIKDKGIQADIKKPVCKLKCFKYSSDSDVSNYNTTSDTNNSDSHSKITIVEHKQVAGETREHNIQSPTSNVHSRFPVCLTNDTVDTEFVSAANRNKHVNAIEATTPSEDVMSLESWKPEVPKTLNVVPITLTNFKCEGNDTHPFITETKEGENPPKLSRQGSYVLDTPSPMLLAHMHTELADRNYIPTPTMNIPQRKQWDIMQCKVEWENKQFIAEDTEASDKLECTVHESDFQHIKSDIFTEPYQNINKSVNRTEAVFAEEHTRLDITPIKHNHTSTDSKSKSLSDQEKARRDSGTCTLNLANELQGSIGSANNPETQLPRKDDSSHHDDIGDSKEDSIEAKSSVASEKLLTVYKEIEEMHRKQMMELIDRQRKEQSLLQAEFQKQQMILLAEIQKYSSGVPSRADVTVANELAPSDKTRLGDSADEAKRQLNVYSVGNVHAEVYCNSNSKLPSTASHANVVVCPLDYISSKHLYLPKHRRSPFTMDTSPADLGSDFTRKIDLGNTAYNNSNNNNNNDDDSNSNYEPYNRTTYKTSVVSRQLFPLDSNTTHVPVLDTSVYLEKHVRAVNIINAYAKGYLVRRLMRTERVITLKKIYKEALQCMLKLHVDAPLNLAEVNFLHRLQLQCDAASMNLVELFSQPPAKRMKVIAQDHEIRQSRAERPTSARSYSFATQKTLARKNLREFESTMTKYQRPLVVKKNIIRSRCQTWTSDIRERLMSPNTLHQSIRRSTSAGTVRKPWR